MTQPRFSIVIPTRDRADTLHYTLQTCLAQSCDDYEIIVCDNCSSAATKETVDALNSSRIRYVRSDQPLAMSANWELAVSQTTGEFVIVIGDDDGLLPDALENIERILRHTGTRALRWERVYYSWPNIPVARAANIVHIPLTAESTLRNGKATVKSVANLKGNYTLLPMLYNSAIHCDLIGELKARTGRVFGGRAPDVYSGIAFAYLVGSYVSVGRPMSINAGSAKSNGVATIVLGGKSPIAEEFHQLNNRGGLECHPQVPDIAALPVELANNFLRAKEALFPGDETLHLDRKRLVTSCVNSIKTRATSPESWAAQMQEIRRSVSDDKELLAWFDKHYGNAQPNPVVSTADAPTKLGFSITKLSLNAADFGIMDVMGVAQLSRHILGKMDVVPTLDRMTPMRNLYRRVRTAARIVIKGM